MYTFRNKTNYHITHIRQSKQKLRVITPDQDYINIVFVI